jgi:RasGEF family protein
MQLILTLQSPSLDSLKQAWSRIPAFEASLFQDLILFGGPWKNFKGVRRAVEAAESGSQACVPFTGLYLSDLMVNEERSSIKLSPSSEENPSDSYITRRIPFWKYRSAAKIIRQFRTFQSPERQYHFPRNHDLYQYLINVVSR